jgi:hypothetical protein
MRQVYVLASVCAKYGFVHLFVEFVQVQNVTDGLIESADAFNLF